jgi:L,D-transpeptidase-like protein
MFAHEAVQVSPLHNDQILYAIEAERRGTLPSDVESLVALTSTNDSHIFPDEGIFKALAAKEKINAAPVERLINYRNAYRPTSRPRFWAVVDFDLHSAKERLFLFDLKENSVSRYLCAHGRGSEGEIDDGYATEFSNRDGSKASSLGIYLCAETFHGDHGYSLKLDGLESTNSNARLRAIVLHGARYVSPEFARRHRHRIGRSKGCPAVEQRYATSIVNALRDGSLMIIWHSDGLVPHNNSSE